MTGNVREWEVISRDKPEGHAAFFTEEARKNIGGMCKNKNCKMPKDLGIVHSP